MEKEVVGEETAVEIAVVDVVVVVAAAVEAAAVVEEAVDASIPQNLLTRSRREQ